MDRDDYDLEFDISCSLQDIRDGIKTQFWKDVTKELNVWLKRLRDLLEDPDGQTPESELRRLGGNAQAVRHVLDIPQVFQEYLEEEAKKTKEE